MSAIKPLSVDHLADDSANATKHALACLNWLSSAPQASIEDLKQLHRETKAARIEAERSIQLLSD